MGLKSYRPTSPGRRGMTAVVTEELTNNCQVSWGRAQAALSHD
jgi:ribosomal protein L2